MTNPEATAPSPAAPRPAAWPVDWLVPEWPAPANVRALCTTRAGGHSRGVWGSLNLAAHVGDEAVAVANNRAVLRDHLPKAPVWLAQVHGVRVIDPAMLDPAAPPPEADAAHTRQPGSPCAVLTADCLPILLCAGRRGGMTTAGAATEVAAIHAGWRGLADGVIEATAAAMQTPPQDWLAWIGPCIGPAAFECGEEVLEAFCRDRPEVHAAFRPHPAQAGRWLGDLPAIARQRLAALGVPAAAVYGGDVCTVSDPARFYSFRRDGLSGRMASLIWLAG